MATEFRWKNGKNPARKWVFRTFVPFPIIPNLLECSATTARGQWRLLELSISHCGFRIHERLHYHPSPDSRPTTGRRVFRRTKPLLSNCRRRRYPKWPRTNNGSKRGNTCSPTPKPTNPRFSTAFPLLSYVTTRVLVTDPEVDPVVKARSIRVPGEHIFSN